MKRILILVGVLASLGAYAQPQVPATTVWSRQFLRQTNGTSGYMGLLAGTHTTTVVTENTNTIIVSGETGGNVNANGTYTWRSDIVIANASSSPTPGAYSNANGQAFLFLDDDNLTSWTINHTPDVNGTSYDSAFLVSYSFWLRDYIGFDAAVQNVWSHTPSFATSSASQTFPNLYPSDFFATSPLPLTTTNNVDNGPATFTVASGSGCVRHLYFVTESAPGNTALNTNLLLSINVNGGSSMASTNGSTNYQVGLFPLYMLHGQEFTNSQHVNISTKWYNFQMYTANGAANWAEALEWNIPIYYTNGCLIYITNKSTHTVTKGYSAFDYDASTLTGLYANWGFHALYSSNYVTAPQVQTYITLLKSQTSGMLLGTMFTLGRVGGSTGDMGDWNMVLDGQYPAFKANGEDFFRNPYLFSLGTNQTPFYGSTWVNNTSSLTNVCAYRFFDPPLTWNQSANFIWTPFAEQPFGVEFLTFYYGP